MVSGVVYCCIFVAVKRCSLNASSVGPRRAISHRHELTTAANDMIAHHSQR